MHDIKMVTETDARLSTHEQVCAERYTGIQKRFDDGSKRMQRIEYILYLIAAMTLFGSTNGAEILMKLFVKG